jgi:hypothetical protein
VLDPRKPLQQLHSFGQWLPKHAALVKSITANASVASGFPAGGPGDVHLEAALQLLQQALQVAAEVSISGTAVATGAAAALPASSGAGSTNSRQQQQQQLQCGLRLASFSSNLPGAPALLHVLPGHSLTHLDLQLHTGTAAEHVQLSQLAHPSSLQELRLDGFFFYALADGCLDGLARLSQLTSLRVTGSWRGINKQLQQLLVQPLPLQELQADVLDIRDTASGLPNLAHPTQLTELITTQNSSKSTALPPQLQTLHLSECRDLAPVLALQQLQHITLCTAFESAAEQRQVLELARLPALQALQLSYRDIEAAAAAAPDWGTAAAAARVELYFKSHGRTWHAAHSNCPGRRGSSYSAH